jgi:hypothetical protein
MLLGLKLWSHRKAPAKGVPCLLHPNRLLGHVAGYGSGRDGVAFAQLGIAEENIFLLGSTKPGTHKGTCLANGYTPGVRLV